MSSPLITALITTYNYGQFLEQAINSILAQDFPPDKIQIVIVDDGSTDDTSERVKKYGSRIEYFYKPNGGQASALNFGFSKAHGEIIALLDADDLFLPSKLSLVAEAFQNDPALGMVYHSLEEWHTQTGQRFKWNHPLISGDARTEPEKFFSYYPHPTSCISFRRSSLNRLLPIPDCIVMLADAFLTNLIPFLSPIFALPETLMLYRIHGENQGITITPTNQEMSLETRRSRLRKWQVFVGSLYKWLADNGYTSKQPGVRSFLDRWTLYLETQEFVLNHPGRLQFFRHLMAYNHCYGPHISRRLRIVNYLNACGSLVTGYEHFYLLDKWRLQLLDK
jgi:glycosyltransferase involved in cell wall biosynthesis